MSYVIGRGRRASETYPSPPPTPSPSGAGWPYGPFFTRTPPPVASNWVPLNFTQQGAQPSPPTFADVGPTGNGGLAIVSPAGVGAWQAQELSIENTNSPWTFIAGVTGQQADLTNANEVTFAGVSIRDSTSGGILVAGVGVPKLAAGIFPGLYLIALTNPVTPVFLEAFGSAMPASPFLAKFQFDGTDISISISVDGVSYLQLLSTTPGTLIGGLASNVGIGVFPATNGSGSLLCWQASLTQP